MYIIFLLISCYLFYQAYRLMSMGWQTQEAGPLQVETKTRQVTRPPHPEMADVKHGDELLVINFNRQTPTDPLLKALDERIYNGQQIDDPWDDDDEDDGDGDVPALLKT
jgi:hypothetical protein